MSYKIKFYLKLILAKHASIYLILYRFENVLLSLFTGKYKDRYSSSIVSKNTDLVIEGFPRCANSFSIRAFFFMDRNQNYNVAHHVHSSAQVVYAVKHEIPSIILIRKPIDAIASYLIRNKSITPCMALHGYINFYQNLIFFKDRCVIAEFDDVINDFGTVIKKVNSKYEKNFDIFIHTDLNKKEIFEATNLRSAKYKLSPEKPLGNNSTKKKKMTNEYVQIIHSQKKLMLLLQKANELYYEFIT